MRPTSKWILAVLLFCIALHFREDRHIFSIRDLTSGKKQVVVITGSTSGIGFELAKRLSKENGFVVFGTYRSAKDTVILESNQIMPLQMDVSSETSIVDAEKSVRTYLENTGNEFLGIVSNAGVLNTGPLDRVKTDMLTQTIDVHLKGTIALTKTFLGLVKGSKGGRIIIMGSLAALLLPPANAAYNAAKAGQHAFALSLRRELADIDISVSLIVCGETRGTKLHEKRQANPVDWANGYEIFQKSFDLGSRWMGNSFMGTTFEELYQITKHSLTSANPQATYYAPWFLRYLVFVMPDVFIENMMRYPPPDFIMGDDEL